MIHNNIYVPYSIYITCELTPGARKVDLFPGKMELEVLHWYVENIS